MRPSAGCKKSAIHSRWVKKQYPRRRSLPVGIFLYFGAYLLRRVLGCRPHWHTRRIFGKAAVLALCIMQSGAALVDEKARLVGWGKPVINLARPRWACSFCCPGPFGKAKAGAGKQKHAPGQGEICQRRLRPKQPCSRGKRFYLGAIWCKKAKQKAAF